jgi:chaperonin cofactor prefoldin
MLVEMVQQNTALTERVETLLKQNTELTQTVRTLVERIDAMTSEVHARMTPGARG